MDNPGANFGVAFHKVCFWLNILILIVLEICVLVFDESGIESKVLSYLVLAVFFSILISLHYFLAKGLAKQNGTARVVSFIYGVLILSGFPVGTFFGVVLILAMTMWWEKSVPLLSPDEPANETDV